MADPAQRQQQRHRRALPRLPVRQSELALADLPAPAAGSLAVGRQARRCGGVVVVRERIADLGQGTARARQGHAGARRPRQCRAPGARSLPQRSDVGGYRDRGARHVRAICHAAAIRRRGWTCSPTPPRTRPPRCARPNVSAPAMWRWPRRGIASVHKAANTKALLDAVPHELHSDPGYLFAKIQELAPRGEISRGRAADAERAARSRPASTISMNGGSSGGCLRAR